MAGPISLDSYARRTSVSRASRRAVAAERGAHVRRDDTYRGAALEQREDLAMGHESAANHERVQALAGGVGWVAAHRNCPGRAATARAAKYDTTNTTNAIAAATAARRARHPPISRPNATALAASHATSPQATRGASARP